MRTITLPEVLSSFGMKIIKVGADSIYYNCPFCGDKKAKFNVIPPPSNVWRCAKCGEGGGLVHFVERINNYNREEAREFLRNFDNSCSFKLDKQIQKKLDNARKEQEKLAPDVVLNAVYSSMLKKLYLRDEHYADLQRRGLSDIAIYNRGYKSIPKCVKNGYNQTIPNALIKEGLSLKGVPGFFKRNGKWYMNNAIQGYLIPYRNVDGLITNLQIRTDEPKKSGKYMSFSSSGLPCGTKVSAQAHFVSKNTNPKVLYLTEGALKGDIATFYIKQLYNQNASFLCIPGVNNTKCLINALKVLKKRGLEKVVDCFDMDKYKPNNCDINGDTCLSDCKSERTCIFNKNVKCAVDKIKDICENELGLKYSQMTWEKEKGIDDYLFATYKDSH